MQLQRWPNHDDGTAGVVDTLTQQVAAETALLALEHVAQALQFALTAAADGATTAPIIHQTINGFLQHALFVAHDDIGCAQLHQAVEAVVAVDHAAIEIVQIAGRKTATIKLHHGAQIRRDDRQRSEHHPLRAVATLAEVFDNAQTLGCLLAALLAARGADFFAQLFGHLIEVDFGHNITDRFGAHTGCKDIPPAVGQLAIAIFGQQLALFQRFEIVQIAFHLVANLLLAPVDFLAIVIDLCTQLTARVIAEGRNLVTNVKLLVVRLILQGVELILHGIVDQHVMISRDHLALLDDNVFRPRQALVFTRLLANAILEPSLEGLGFGNGLRS